MTNQTIAVDIQTDAATENKVAPTSLCSAPTGVQLFGQAEPHTAARGARLVNLDRLRLLAITEIVAFHIAQGDGHILWGLGLPTFLVLACALTAHRPAPEPMERFLDKRARRLLGPWLFWSGVYGVYLLIRAARHGMPWSEVFEPTMLLYGTYIHLWFLPYIFVAGLVVHLLHRASLRQSDRTVFVVGLGAAMGLAILAQVFPAPLPSPMKQWWGALPAIPLGLVVGRAIATHGRAPSRSAWWMVALICLPAAIIGQAIAPVTPLPRYLMVTAVVSLAILYPGRRDPLTDRLLPWLYGLYLVHPLLIFHLYLVLGSSDPLALWLILTLALSLAVVALLSRTPLRHVV